MTNIMKRIINTTLVCLVMLALAGGAWMNAEGESDTKAAVSADQMITAIKAAVAAKAGHVLSTEAEKEGGKTICKVLIHAEDGKIYEVEVDAATGKVLEVEAEGK